jgi:hypothetical protein
MAILNPDLSKFKSIITINSRNSYPAFEDFSSDLSVNQARLSSDRRASREFGMDFLMFSKGGLFYDEFGGIKKATGIFNYAQGLTHRLATDRGTMPGSPIFGVPWSSYLGKTYKSASIVIANLREEIVEEVFRDRRTSRIDDITVSFLDPNTVNIDLTVVPIFTNNRDYDSISINLTNAGA